MRTNSSRQFGGRVTQDRRGMSRVPARLKCEIIFEQVTYPAVLVDISLGGAFLTSKFLPPVNSIIQVCVHSGYLRKPLTVKAMVVRGVWAMTHDGKTGRFGVRFHDSSLELIHLVNGLQSEQRT